MKPLIGMFVLSISLCAFAQSSASKTKVMFICKCEDQVGMVYATAVRDRLAASPRFTETNQITTSVFDNASTPLSMTIRVVSMDPSSNNLGQHAVLSIVVLKGTSTLIRQDVQWCPAAQVNACADSSMADLDSAVQAVRNPGRSE